MAEYTAAGVPLRFREEYIVTGCDRLRHDEPRGYMQASTRREGGSSPRPSTLSRPPPPAKGSAPQGLPLLRCLALHIAPHRQQVSASSRWGCHPASRLTAVAAPAGAAASEGVSYTWCHLATARDITRRLHVRHRTGRCAARGRPRLRQAHPRRRRGEPPGRQRSRPAWQGSAAPWPTVPPRRCRPRRGRSRRLCVPRPRARSLQSPADQSIHPAAHRCEHPASCGEERSGRTSSNTASCVSDCCDTQSLETAARPPPAAVASPVRTVAEPCHLIAARFHSLRKSTGQMTTYDHQSHKCRQPS